MNPSPGPNENQPGGVSLRNSIMVHRPLTRPLLGLALFITPVLSAQVTPGLGVVRGTLVSADGRPVTEAIVELRVRADSARVRTARSGEATSLLD